MKILISEEQLKTVKSLVIEQNNTENFRNNVNITFTYYDTTKNGQEINDISATQEVIYYDISLDKTSWGYNGITLNSINGAETIETEIEYFVDEDNTETEPLILKMDWDQVEFEEVTNVSQGMIGIDTNVQVNLINNEEGEIIVKNIVVGYFGLNV